MFDAVTDRGIFRINPAGRVVHWTAGAQLLLGYSDSEVLGEPVSMFHTPTDRSAGLAGAELELAQENGHGEFEGWRVRRDGSQFRAAVTIRTVEDGAGLVSGFVIVMRDVAADQRRAHPLFAEMFEAAPDAMVIVGPDGRITLANAQADRLFGYSREELVGSEVEMLVPPRFRGTHVPNRLHFLDHPELRPMSHGLDLWGLRRDGTEFPVDVSLSPLRVNNTVHVFAAIRDVTERHDYEQKLLQQQKELIQAQEELQRLARVDTLTGLVNHAESIARLRAALANRRVPGSGLGVLFCDADHFKYINDTYGHAVGDVVLATLAQRIRECLRDSDTVGRIGGDEMIVLLPGVHDLDEVVSIAEKIRRSAAEPIFHGGYAIEVTVSLGATLANPGESATELTSRADAAMYQAKQAGRNTTTTLQSAPAR